MFVIQFGKGKNRRFFDAEMKERKGLPGRKTIEAATAFGEDLRAKFESNGNLILKTIEVSPIAEMMYRDKAVKVSKICW